MRINRSIVFVVNNLGYGGAQKMIAFVAKSCTTLFDKVYLISLSPQETLIEVNKQISIRKLNYRTGRSVREKLNYKIEVIKKLREEIEHIEPVLVCAFGADALFISRLATIFKKIKLVGSERNAPESYSKIWKIINKINFSFCHGLVFQTNQAMRFYGKKILDKSTVIPNPYLDVNEYQKPFDGKREKLITTAAASFEYRKGIDVLIKAFAKINEKYPDYLLVIYGEGPLLNEYKKLIKTLNIEKYVVFPGTVKNVSKEVYNSSVFVLPSRNEGIPNVLIEVMGVGVPVLATNCPPGGPAYLTDNGRRGILVDVDDIEGMANGIAEIIQDENLSKKLSDRATEILDVLDPQKIAEKWKDYFYFIIKD
ncbi:glycosyltransferase involved in cell wall biosynthesis [Gracilibacillus halotolerans]|uniref:Glycosyltransferase involved in cell wall biosynthesis n=1 Tax=Gracilibacillus halotolerans TaxID=74386 RepID=A0A841RPK7_9BACI|nr:glycosyltransferase [Gracilibacillus halotolerans]MBB6512864.1 glycosyltransferase involved in cell wall biosynthesis [Gracilibacillus halotolerans]